MNLISTAVFTLGFARTDYRHTCNRLLFRAHLPPGTVIKGRCPKCGKMYEIKEPLNNKVEV